ncbi:MAG: tRNA (adenosine(37)-N6)-threonylcarbamoyltransferase complex dimerization subunit type 1 TsaB [Bacteroidota bacterium]|nr:tRNA (adenosine(37)-N6)-threonylcarbamoyltransferase complex dimerization subunit type 1 TsaB [Bacteroidota bacterium]
MIFYKVVPIILNIETSTKSCSVAISKDSNILSFRSNMDDNFNHAKILHKLIDEVFNESLLKQKQLDCVSISSGPGSFTGLRIGASAAKGFCFSLDIPLIEIPTLKIIIEPFLNFAKVVSVQDSIKDEIYYSIFNNKGVEIQTIKSCKLSENIFKDLMNENIHFVGTGIEKIKSEVKKSKKWKFTEAPPQATSMVELSESFFKMKKFVDYENFSPSYIKPARITRTKRDNLRQIIR